MIKIKMWPCPHVEVRVHVSEEMVKDIKKCRKMINETRDGADCNVCSWKDVEVGDMILCGEDMLKAIEAKLEEKSPELTGFLKKRFMEVQ